MNRYLQEYLRRANHAQRVVRTPGGVWLWLEETGPAARGRITLHRGEAEAASLEPVAILAGPQGCCATSGAQASTLCLPDGALAVAFVSDGTACLTRCAAAGDLATWSQPDPILTPAGRELLVGNLVVTHDQHLMLPWAVQGPGAESVVGVTVGTPGDWRAHTLAEGRGAFAPHAYLSRDGVLHLAWAQADEQVFYTRLSAAPERCAVLTPPVRVSGEGRQPVLLGDVAGGAVLLVYEAHVSRLDALVIREGVPAAASCVTGNDPRFTRAICHSAQLVRDGHGVPTLFFAENHRGQVFVTRWLGEGWGPVLSMPALHHHTARADHSYLQVGRVHASGQPSAADGATGLVMQPEVADVPPRWVGYEPVAWDPAADATLRFLDLRELTRLESLAWRVRPATKAEQNPLIPTGPPGSFNARRAVNRGSFIHTDQGWEAWFTGTDVPDERIGFEWWKALRTGYARSGDGLRWAPAGPGRHGELHDLPGQHWVYYDPHDADPARRYKLVYFLIAGEKELAAQAGAYDPLDDLIPGWLFTSADGVRWRKTTIRLRSPGGQWFEHCPMCLIEDPDDPDPSRRWKTYGYASLTLGRRSCSLATSPDLIDWTLQEEPALPAEVYGHPWVPAGPQSQVHGMIVYRMGRCYVALTEYQIDAARSTIELAVSRDGLRFDPLGVGEPVVAPGPAGAWDCGRLMPMNLCREADRWRVYYTGTNLPEPGCNIETSVGVAYLEPDGLTALELDPHRGDGRFVTAPIRLNPAGRYRLRMRAEHVRATVTRLDEEGNTLAVSDPLLCQGEPRTITWSGDTHWSGGRSALRLDVALRSTNDRIGRVTAIELQPVEAQR